LDDGFVKHGPELDWIQRAMRQLDARYAGSYVITPHFKSM
jgi:hypothetical protein